MKSHVKTIVCTLFVAVFAIASLATAQDKAKEYAVWKSLAERTASEASKVLKRVPSRSKALVLTNAGCAVVDGHSTEPSLDGLQSWKGASAGKGTLLDVHSARNSALWFLFHDMGTGDAVYFEVNGKALEPLLSRLPQLSRKTIRSRVFALRAKELFARIDHENIGAKAVFADPAAWNQKAKAGVFGGHAFALVTIANAVSHGASCDVIRAALFHDHYCPGVTSGVILANYLESRFPAGPGGRYFIQAVDPWCKEDALLELLNSTPGKRGYAAYYPSDADKARRLPEAAKAATIAYRQQTRGGAWDGVVLAFDWPDTGCAKAGGGIAEKLCTDLWFLKRMDKPEDFVKVVKSFELPKGTSPLDWARPGVDPLEKLGLLQPPAAEKAQ